MRGRGEKEALDTLCVLWESCDMSLRHRPRFDLRVDLDPAAAEALLRDALVQTELPIRGAHFPGQFELQVKDAARHVWSPHMSVLFEQRDDGTRVTGHVGPNMAIWSLFITAYGALGIFTTAGLTFGYSQWSLGQTPYGFWFAGACALATVAVWALGKLGERLATPQTEQLHEFLRGTLRARDAESVA